MSSISFSFCRSAAMFVALIVSSPIQVAVSQDSPGSRSPDREVVRAAIARFQATIKSGFHVKYQVQQRLVRDDCGFGYAHVGGSAGGKSVKPVWLAEHAISGSRFLDRTARGSEFSTDDITSMHDGENYYRVDAERSVATGYAGTRTKAPGPLMPQERLYFELIGFEAPWLEGHVTIRGLKSPHAFDVLEVVQDDSYSFGYDGENPTLLLLEKAGVDSLWLDETRGYAVKKRIRHRNSGSPWMMIENSSFVELDEGIWLPQASSLVYYSSTKSACAGEPALTADLSTVALELNPPDSLFAPRLDDIIQVGMMHDRGGGKIGIKRYDVKGVDGKDLTEYLKTAKEMTSPNAYNSISGSLFSTTWGRRIFLIGNFAVLSGVAGFIFYRRRRKVVE